LGNDASPIIFEGNLLKKMKAIVQDRYGSPDLLELRDVERPVVNDDEVLVRVNAAGLHIGDCFGVRGSPLVLRMATGLLKPRHGPGFHVPEAARRHFQQR